MQRKTVIFAQNEKTDEFEKIDETMYHKILNGETDKYINNIVNVHYSDGNTIPTMYDILIENVCGNVVGCLVKLFHKLGLEV